MYLPKPQLPIAGSTGSRCRDLPIVRFQPSRYFFIFVCKGAQGSSRVLIRDLKFHHAIPQCFCPQSCGGMVNVLWVLFSH